MGGDRFGRSQKEESAGVEGLVHQGDGPVLEFPGEVDEQVAADDQVHMQEGRVLQQVVMHDDQTFPEHRGHGEAALLGFEVPVDVFPVEVVLAAQGVKSLAGRVHGGPVDVRGEDFKAAPDVRVLQIVVYEHGQGISLFARGTADDPDPDAVDRGPATEKLGQHPVAHLREGVRVAEKRGHPDEQALQEQIAFVLAVGQGREKVAGLIDAGQDHAFLDAPGDGAAPVSGQIVSRGLPDADQYRIDEGGIVRGLV